MKNKSIYQKTAPITKHTDITQKSPNLSKQLGNSKSLQRNQQNLDKYQNVTATFAVLRNGFSNLPYSNVPKGPTTTKHTGITQKCPKLSEQLENLKKSTLSKKNIKILQQSLQY